MNFKVLAGLEVAFAAEPIFHRSLQSIEWHAVTRLQHSIGDGERVVKDCVVGEVAHGEVVDPADGAGMALAR